MIADTAPPAPSLTRLAKVLPFALLAVISITPLVWNFWARVTWQWPDAASMMLLLSPCLLISAYAYFRGAPKLGEVSAFMAVYFVYSFFGTRLTYIVTTLDFPLADAKMHDFDAMFGFDWARWLQIVSGNSFLHAIHATIYPIHFYQIAFSIIIFGYLRPASRNYEMLFLLTASLIIGLGLFAVFPTLGPASLAGIPSLQETIISLLRQGRGVNLPYSGIISFPSFHTVMALTFMYCHRGIRQTFIPVVVLNLLMLFTLPYGGDHYVADLAGGAAVFLAALGAARRLYP